MPEMLLNEWPTMQRSCLSNALCQWAGGHSAIQPDPPQFLLEVPEVVNIDVKALLGPDFQSCF